MFVARILYPVKTLGPGDRIAIWVAGCPHKCHGCCSPELWDSHEKYRISVETVCKLINQIAENHKIDGFTLTGGDPMFQEKELNELLKFANSISDDIIVYTGYRLEELQLKTDILSRISVLIDGKYIEALNDGSILRGSSNQNIHILDTSKEEKYKRYFETVSNKIQNFQTSDGRFISVGIHHKRDI